VTTSIDGVPVIRHCAMNASSTRQRWNRNRLHGLALISFPVAGFKSPLL